MKLYKHGIFTPEAAVLCLSCHGPTIQQKQFEGLAWEYIQKPAPLEEENSTTNCDQCGVPIQIENSIAREHSLMRDLRGIGINANMWQTGGMKHAVGIIKRHYTEDQIKHGVPPYYLITYDFEGDKKFHLTDTDGELSIKTAFYSSAYLYMKKLRDFCEWL